MAWSSAGGVIGFTAQIGAGSFSRIAEATLSGSCLERFAAPSHLVQPGTKEKMSAAAIEFFSFYAPANVLERAEEVPCAVTGDCLAAAVSVSVLRAPQAGGARSTVASRRCRQHDVSGLQVPVVPRAPMRLARRVSDLRHRFLPAPAAARLFQAASPGSFPSKHSITR